MDIIKCEVDRIWDEFRGIINEVNPVMFSLLKVFGEEVWQVLSPFFQLFETKENLKDVIDNFLP